MPNHRARRSQVIRGLIGVAAVVLAVVIVWALLVPGTDWLARHDVSAAKGSLATARDAARGRLLTLGAGLLAAGALLFTARNFILSREGQVTDRYTKAVEQLGSDKLDVRIGGIYALERIARDSKKDHPTVMEVLTAFIREHSQEPWPVDGKGAQQGGKKTRPDIQAAVIVAGRRDAKRDILLLDLAGANLTRANLTRANLDGADLTGADLTRANLAPAFFDLKDARAHLSRSSSRVNRDGARLVRARLSDANLTSANLLGADLTRARLDGAVLTRAHLLVADLTRANLTGADLTGADLSRADLTNTVFWGANLTRANLLLADLTSADLRDANLTGADLDDANLDGADLAGTIWPEGVQVPEGWTVDSDSGDRDSTGEY